MRTPRSSAALRWVQAAGFAVLGAFSMLACSSPADDSSESTDSASTAAAREGQSCASRHCATGLTCVPAATGTKKTCQVEDAPVIASFFSTPSDSGQQPVIDAINGAQSTIRMMMFHLTTTNVVDALVAAAGRGVDVQIILD